MFSGNTPPFWSKNDGRFNSSGNTLSEEMHKYKDILGKVLKYIEVCNNFISVHTVWKLIMWNYGINLLDVYNYIKYQS